MNSLGSTVRWGEGADSQEIDDLVDEWQPTPLVDDPTDYDEGTLDSVPTIQGPNGLKVKIQPNGKTVRLPKSGIENSD